MDIRTAAARWADTWVTAWRSHDAGAVAALYAEDCTHRSLPFRPPYHGRAGVLDYLRDAFADESAVADVRFNTPVVDGHRAWVEYWAAVVDGTGAEQTIAGSAFARFDDAGLITETRDYWQSSEGHHPPPDGWQRA
ncbi:nuclear transport factor 2 family protein [Dactylosporangium aurantiacum]|uniref:Nuclear transport factor 2 family protein n=1 Tax=Dactylosporangium aurantiacum TaxID=35754 RepID=A0A9Q9IB44_9ACTN|nr:nuclear transport factor 2 family protein [Dactylosporangium aurantiacum]MDG6106590.1 nuclear transport factor 2 family protein [Dactylosporangium aurantiacum]UWZ50752.1 nuclear transport factor 2 family protein [Dactylosporangium aurantiacum]